MCICDEHVFAIRVFNPTLKFTRFPDYYSVVHSGVDTCPEHVQRSVSDPDVLVGMLITYADTSAVIDIGIYEILYKELNNGRATVVRKELLKKGVNLPTKGRVKNR